MANEAKYERMYQCGSCAQRWLETLKAEDHEHVRCPNECAGKATDVTESWTQRLADAKAKNGVRQAANEKVRAAAEKVKAEKFATLEVAG